MTPEELRVTIAPDAPVTPDYLNLWRRLLAPTPAADLPPVLGDLADALERAEGGSVTPQPPASPPLVEPPRGFVNREEGSEAGT